MAAWFSVCLAESGRVNRPETIPAQQNLTRELQSPFDFRALHKMHPDRYPFLLQSTSNDNALGRFDILFAYPGEALCLEGLNKLAGPCSESGVDFLRALDQWWQREACDSPGSTLPFNGGWFLYLGYELAAQVEPTLNLRTDDALPTAFAVRCPAAFVYDHDKDTGYAVCEDAFAHYLEPMLLDAASPRHISGNSNQHVNLESIEEPPGRYLSAVRQAKEHIAAGDIFQANLSRAWHVELADQMSADDIYERLAYANPAPFAGLIRWNGVAIISSSPERLISVRQQRVSTRPIAGTRPRARDGSTDSALSAELLANPKERAEHVMLIDLERNDLGRVCEAGSVEVDEFMVLESYTHVHHIVSSVRGKLKPGLTPGDAIRAVFPGGTITGCPKVRCMEIISELEQGPRGAYTGSFGYLNRNGSLDLNILIRTMVMSDGQIELKAGSGIVADSDPDAELAETRAKAKGLLLALARSSGEPG